MSIDYDMMRERVEDYDQAVTFHQQDDAQQDLAVAAPDMARELLRLRRELTDLRNLMHTHAGYLRKDRYDIAADHAENHAYRLTRILEGDTE